MRQIVSNTGPILHLHEIAAIDLLRFAGDVRIPTAVNEKLDNLIVNWTAIRPGWLQVIEPTSAAHMQVQAWLQAGIIHAGETAALALARHTNPGWFLTDDAAARLVGRTIGLEVHGSLGVVLWTAAAGHLDRHTADDLIGKLAASSLWISPRILAEARDALEQLFRT